MSWRKLDLPVSAPPLFDYQSVFRSQVDVTWKEESDDSEAAGYRSRRSNNNWLSAWQDNWNKVAQKLYDEDKDKTMSDAREFDYGVSKFALSVDASNAMADANMARLRQFCQQQPSASQPSSIVQSESILAEPARMFGHSLVDSVLSGPHADVVAYVERLQPVHSCSLITLEEILQSGGLRCHNAQPDVRRTVYHQLKDDFRDYFKHILPIDVNSAAEWMKSSGSYDDDSYRDTRMDQVVNGKCQCRRCQDLVLNLASVRVHELRFGNTRTGCQRRQTIQIQLRDRTSLTEADFAEIDRIADTIAEQIDGTTSAGIGYWLDSFIGTNENCFAVLGPNVNYGGVSLVLNQDCLEFEGTSVVVNSAATFFSGSSFELRPWAIDAELRLSRVPGMNFAVYHCGVAVGGEFAWIPSHLRHIVEEMVEDGFLDPTGWKQNSSLEDMEKLWQCEMVRLRRAVGKSRLRYTLKTIQLIALEIAAQANVSFSGIDPCVSMAVSQSEFEMTTKAFKPAPGKIAQSVKRKLAKVSPDDVISWYEEVDPHGRAEVLLPSVVPLASIAAAIVPDTIDVILCQSLQDHVELVFLVKDDAESLRLQKERFRTGAWPQWARTPAPPVQGLKTLLATCGAEEAVVHARTFLHSHGARTMQEIMDHNLEAEFLAALQLKPIPASRVRSALRELSGPPPPQPTPPAPSAPVPISWPTAIALCARVGCGKGSWNGQVGEWCSMVCKSYPPPSNLCARHGCNKNSWNGQPGNFCSTSCKQLAQVPTVLPVAAGCRGGCGRPAATGFDSCCQSCLHSLGARHGPRCDEIFRATLEMPQQLNSGTQIGAVRCRGGCNRPPSAGFDTCCQTCAQSAGTRHGPRCEAMYQQASAALTGAAQAMSSGSQTGVGGLGRLQSQVEEVSIVPTTKWEDFVPDLGLLESLRMNAELRTKVPEIDRILMDVEDKIGDLKFDANARELVQLLDDDELASIVAYTHDLQQPAGRRDGNFYYEENQDLRKRGLESRALMMRTWGAHVYYTMRGLGKLPDFAGEVFRGFSNLNDVLQQYHEGRKIQWGAWSSTTLLKQAAMNFAGATGAILKIKIFTGKDIKKLSFFASEGEILLSPNHKFVVTSAPYTEGGFTFVDMMELRGFRPYVS